MWSPQRRSGAVVLLVLVGIAALGVAVTGQAPWATERVLVVEDAESGERLLQTPVENGSVVVLNYTHSVEKTRVLDIYGVAGDTLVMTRMEFESYGWGLPARANVTHENGTFAFDPAWEGEEVYVKPGRIAGHKLHVDDRTYDLVALSDARSVRISIDTRPSLAVALDELDS